MPERPPLPADFYSPAARADPLGYYQRHFAGLTRGQLSRLVPTYNRLWSKGLLAALPTKRAGFGDPVAYYRQHYDGLGRTELKIEDPRLHYRLEREGLLYIIPRHPSYRPKWTVFDPLAYFRQHYAALSRAELRERDLGFYRRLRATGLLETAIPARADRPAAPGSGAAAAVWRRSPRLLPGILRRSDAPGSRRPGREAAAWRSTTSASSRCGRRAPPSPAVPTIPAAA